MYALQCIAMLYSNSNVYSYGNIKKTLHEECKRKNISFRSCTLLRFLCIHGGWHVPGHRHASTGTGHCGIAPKGGQDRMSRTLASDANGKRVVCKKLFHSRQCQLTKICGISRVKSLSLRHTRPNREKQTQTLSTQNVKQQ